MTSPPEGDPRSHAISKDRGEQINGRTATDPFIGRSVDGFRIESLVGRGGMGVVYRAVNESGRAIALKLVAPELAQSRDFRERFLREAEIDLQHPNIIPVYGAGEDEGLLYIAMHLVEGRNLKQLIVRGDLTPRRTVSLIAQAASALDFAHANEMVHRDVKPQNILVEDGDHVYLTDFGLVKRASSDSSFTSSGHLVGSAHYVPPEQIEGKGVDGRADVYALGCVVHECLTGTAPFERDEEISVIWAHVNAPVPSPSVAKEHLPAAVDAVVARAMAKDPADRYLTPGDMAAALADALGVSESRVRSPWAAPQLAPSRSTRARLSPPRVPVPVGLRHSLASTRGFLVGAAAMVALVATALGAADEPPNRQAPPAAQADAVTSDGGKRTTSGGRASASRTRRPDTPGRRSQNSPAILDPGVGPGIPTFPSGDPPTLSSPMLRSIGSAGSGLTRSLILFSNNERYSAGQRGFHGSMDLYAMRADGTALRSLSAADANKTEMFFDISSCGQVLILRSRGTALPRLVIQELDGRVVFEGEWPRFETQFDWSPDCTKILYSPLSSDAAISLMDADGGNRRVLFDHPYEPLHPRWSPDGTQIAFDMRASDDSAPNIWVINADGTGLTRVTGGQQWEADPWWSPDGRWIAYRRGVLGGGEADVWIMKADGSDQQRLTDAIGDDRPLGWSPDGSYIAFFTDRETRAYAPSYLRGDIYVMNPDGSQERDLIPDRGGDEGWASWQPPVHRTVSAHVEGRVLSGRVRAILTPCSTEQEVEIQRMETDGWATIGAVTTAPSGVFDVTVPSSGVFRARLALKAADGFLICGIAESRARTAS